MKREINLKWNVLLHEFNSDRIIPYNVLDDDYIKESMVKSVKKKEITTFSELKDFLIRKFKARYMSRAEYEIYVSGLFDTTNARKMDVWEQIEMNIDNIVSYIIGMYKFDLKNK